MHSDEPGVPQSGSCGGHVRGVQLHEESDDVITAVMVTKRPDDVVGLPGAHAQEPKLPRGMLVSAVADEPLD